MVAIFMYQITVGSKQTKDIQLNTHINVQSQNPAGRIPLFLLQVTCNWTVG